MCNVIDPHVHLDALFQSRNSDPDTRFDFISTIYEYDFVATVHIEILFSIETVFPFSFCQNFRTARTGRSIKKNGDRVFFKRNELSAYGPVSLLRVRPWNGETGS